MRGRRSPVDRLLSRISIQDRGHTTECWISTYKPAHAGYITIRLLTDAYRMAHRVMYEHFVGPIGIGLQLDHLCRQPPCIRPLHMEEVTAQENTLRGTNTGAAATRTNRCHRGHSLDGAAIFNGSRKCRLCSNERQRTKRHEANS